MTALLLASLLAVQAAAAPQTPTAKGSISGVVLHSATGDPVPNVRVTLARMDTPKAAQALSALIGRDPEGAPPGEVTLPVEYFKMMKAEMATMQRQMEMARQSGAKDIPDDAIPPEFALFNELEIDNIHAMLVDPSGKLAIVSKSAPPTVTNGAGQFTFQNLEPGLYRLIFSANGMVKKDYGQRGAGGGTPIVLEPGQSVSGLTMRMSPTGAVAGRLTDNTGQPVAGIPVQLLRFAYDATGARKAKVVTSIRTNDRGEYRFYYLSPGRYTVQAGNPAARTSIEEEEIMLSTSPFGAIAAGLGSSASPNRSEQQYTLIYYPGTFDPNTAAPIDVPAGAEVAGIDLVMSTQRYFRVRGRIIDPRTGQPPRSASVNLTSLDSAGNGGNSVGEQHYNPDDGAFDLRAVAAGNYILRVSLPNMNSRGTPAFSSLRDMPAAEREAYMRAQQETSMAEQAATPRIAVPITVNSDIDGLAPTAVLGSRLSGSLRIEGANATRGVRMEQQINLELRALGPDGAPIPGYDSSARVGQNIKADGTFRFEGVLAGDYRLRIQNRLPPGFFVKSARIGEIDALNSTVTLPIRDPNALLEIVISSNAGTIEGAATLPDGHSLPGAQVVLIPDGNRNRTELFRTITADAAGHFTLVDVAPGEYRLAAWPSLETFGYFDPVVIHQAEEQGKPVRVTESSKQQVNLQAIASADAP